VDALYPPNLLKNKLEYLLCINPKTKPHLYKKWGLDIQSMATSRLRFFLSFFAIFMQLFKTFFIFADNCTDFLIINLSAVSVIVQRAFWILL